ncbi:MAG: acetate/propionate family kinase [Dokdonella sp.]
MSSAILVLNAGSSSVKFALYDQRPLTPLLRGAIDGIGNSARVDASGPCAAALLAADALPQAGSHEVCTQWLLDAIRERLPKITLQAAGHRVVHGGATFSAPTRIDDTVLRQLEALTPLAPNHQPANLAAIRAVTAIWPELPQIACFDTSFHRSQPRLAQLFALPRELIDAGIVRYGFHGLSYEYLSGILPDFVGDRANARVVIAHLGHGASMCALREGRSIATTMGFTTLDGLMMGSRCGALDAGVVLYLLREKKMSVDQVDRMLNKQSGLLGVSTISDDVRELEASSDARAAEALQLFAYRAARELGSLVAALGGLDVLVFSAGIGEHSASTRQRICRYLQWLGVALDPVANAQHATRISAESSALDVLVIPTNEELVIARAAQTMGLAQSA